jgi:hypothetical protein
MRPTESYHMSNQWKFDENFVEHDIFEIGGLIEGDNQVYLSPLFINCHEKMGYE